MGCEKAPEKGSPCFGGLRHEPYELKLRPILAGVSSARRYREKIEGRAAVEPCHDEHLAGVERIASAEDGGFESKLAV